MKTNPKKDLITFGDKITYEPFTYEQREEIIECMSQNRYLEAIYLVKKMIKTNIEYILENTQEIKEEKTNKRREQNKKNEKEELDNLASNEKPLINLAKITNDDLHKLTIEKIISTYLYYQEYFSNILLIIHIYLKMNFLDRIYRTLMLLKSEMELNKFYEINQLIIKFMVQNENYIKS